MYNELTVNIGSQESKVFLQDGFQINTSPADAIHEHNYAEIHCISGGRAVFMIGKKTFSMNGETVLLIPGRLPHCCLELGQGARHSAFQIDCAVDNIKEYKPGEGLVFGFFEQIEQSSLSNNYATVCSYISLFCSCLGLDEKKSLRRISDYNFIMYEFFTRNYNSDVKLRDLAELLCLSERQTERLVFGYTGMKFKDKIGAERVAMARHLQSSTNMTLKEIAEYVGYRSYSGFFKAIKKYKERRQ